MADVNGKIGYENRDINIGEIVKIGILSLVVIVAVILFTRDYYLSAKEAMIYQMVLEPESQVLDELQKREREMLDSYDIIDQEIGKFRIPIERAKEIIISESNMDRSNEVSE